MGKLMYLWLAVKTVLCSCGPDHRTNDFKRVKKHYSVEQIGTLPAVANESSGLERRHGNPTFWTMNDSGGKSELYEIDSTGKLVSTLPIEGAKNVDWEDLAADSSALYIGDFGNNSNARRDLTVYKITPEGQFIGQIHFAYGDQKGFPPPKEQFNFDCEAFFSDGKSLYLFSKNLGKSGQVKLYKLSNQPGNYTIQPSDSIKVTSRVTSAAISPDGKTFALLTYGKILLFGIGSEGISFKHPKGCFRFVRKQTEAILFVNNTDLLVTNEQGSLYRITYR